MRRRSLWKCPRCRARFVTRNMPHSCIRRSVEDFLEGKPEAGVKLFRYFLREYRKIGPITLHPVRTRIALMDQIRFCGIYRIGDGYIAGTFLLTEQHPGSRIERIEFIPRMYYLHYFRIRARSEIDAAFRNYMRMAYAVGRRRHLTATC